MGGTREIFATATFVRLPGMMAAGGESNHVGELNSTRQQHEKNEKATKPNFREEGETAPLSSHSENNTKNI